MGLKNFKKGDHVVMHTCYESTLEKYKGKIWKCRTDSYLDKGDSEIVFLEGFSGAFFCEFLHFVKLETEKQ